MITFHFCTVLFFGFLHQEQTLLISFEELYKQRYQTLFSLTGVLDIPCGPSSGALHCSTALPDYSETHLPCGWGTLYVFLLFFFRIDVVHYYRVGFLYWFIRCTTCFPAIVLLIIFYVVVFGQTLESKPLDINFKSQLQKSVMVLALYSNVELRLLVTPNPSGVFTSKVLAEIYLNS